MKTLSYSLFALLASATLGVAQSAQHLTQREVEEKRQLGLHLLSLAPNVDPVWKSLKDVYELRRKHTHFFDLTDVYKPGSHPTFPYGRPPNSEISPYDRPRHQADVRRLISRVLIPNMKAWMTMLTAFETRFYTTQTGIDASLWIRDEVSKIIRSSGHRGASVALFSHSFAQSSIIARIPGRRSGPVTILGCHMDSIDDFSEDFTGRAPGADDDGTGVVNLFEAFRILVQSGFQPDTPVEFHWYAAEEIGLRGSVDIATRYRDTGVKVKGMMQFDMTGYSKPGTVPTVGLISDYTNANLNQFVIALLGQYTSLAYSLEPCGYGCSDHASWNRTGFPSTFPFETKFADFNPNIHSVQDTVNVPGFSWTHSAEFAKLAIAFAYELAL